MKDILTKICLKGSPLKCNIVERAIYRLAFLNDLCLNKVVTVEVSVNLFYELLTQASLRFNTVCNFLITQATNTLLHSFIEKYLHLSLIYRKTLTL